MGRAKSSAALLINEITLQHSYFLCSIDLPTVRYCVSVTVGCWKTVCSVQLGNFQIDDREKSKKNRHRPVPSETSDFSIAIFRVPTLWEFKKKKTPIENERKVQRIRNPVPKKKKNGHYSLLAVSE